MLPDPIKNFIAIFSKLPSIGLRQSTRLAFYLINKGKNQIEETAKVISDLKYLKICSMCFFVHSGPIREKSSNGAGKENLCDICQDKNRQNNIFMVLEKETDLISIERTKKFKGRYLVLGELTKSGDMKSAQKLRLNHLKNIIKKELGTKAEEIIIATNPTTYGDLNAMIITKELKDFAKKITRLGRGIPTGGEIEFADEETLGQALERRI